MTRSTAHQVKSTRSRGMTRTVAILAALLLMPLLPTAYAAGRERFILHEAPRELPALAFTDTNGQQRALAEFRGKVVLLNIWATWCGPCRREMPALDRVQTKLGGPDFEVAALSIDRAGSEAVKKFYAETGVRNLGLYVDTSGSAARQLNAIGLPITVLIDREGRERGRLIGPAEWDTPEMITFLRHIVAERTGPLGHGSRSGALLLPAEHPKAALHQDGSPEPAMHHERRRDHA
jgi:thiol-disulfide isomerase/thioredoxin